MNSGTNVKFNEARPLRVVILDDLPYVREAIKKLAGSLYERLSFIEFGNGDDACQELSRETPDLFISDFNHPGMACQEIFAQMIDEGKRCPVLMISAVAEFAGRDLVRFSGPAPLLDISVVSKPFMAEDLWRVLDKYFGPPSRSRAATSSGKRQRYLP